MYKLKNGAFKAPFQVLQVFYINYMLCLRRFLLKSAAYMRLYLPFSAEYAQTIISTHFSIPKAPLSNAK